jgi:hypothetical protein
MTKAPPLAFKDRGGSAREIASGLAERGPEAQWVLPGDDPDVAGYVPGWNSLRNSAMTSPLPAIA